MPEVELAFAEGGESIALTMQYDAEYRGDPLNMLSEKDLLAPLFDSFAEPVYYLNTSRIRAEIKDFEFAMVRFVELAVNWQTVEKLLLARPVQKWVLRSRDFLNNELGEERVTKVFGKLFDGVDHQSGEPPRGSSD